MILEALPSGAATTRRGPVLVGTSWKMTKTVAESLDYVRAVLTGLARIDPQVGTRVDPRVDVVPFLLPAHTSLAAVRGAIPADSPVLVGAQDAHWAEEGEWTGAVSMRMVREAGASIVEIGHAERRRHFGETDAVVARKVRAALDHGLTPLVCLGESAAERAAGDTPRVLSRQLRGAVGHLDGAELARVVLAYEPVWAIGDEPAEPTVVAGAVRLLREACSWLVPHGAPRAVLYGGGVTAETAPDLLAAGPDGLFVGRAGWDPDAFVDLISHCAALVPRPGRSPR